MMEALLILAALFLGYYLPIRLSLKTIHYGIETGISILILLMSYAFGHQLNAFQDVLFSLLGKTLLFIITLAIVNISVVHWYAQRLRRNHKLPSPNPKHNQQAVDQNKSHHIIQFLYNSRYLGWLLIGVLIGILSPYTLNWIDHVVGLLLIMLLFIIGNQLCQEGMSLTQILRNKQGVCIVVLLVLSSWGVAIILSWITDINTPTSLMLTSGFGWYSLSSVMNNQLLGPEYGIMTFFIDFTREMIALALIPFVRRWLDLEMVAYSGATAMDFVLPAIKQNYGSAFLPPAICCGFLLTFVTPAAIPIFNFFNG